MAEEVVYPLDQFAVDELVLARNVNREEPFWPVCSFFHPVRLFFTATPRTEMVTKHSVLLLKGHRRGPCKASSGEGSKTDATRQTLRHVLWSGCQ